MSLYLKYRPWDFDSIVGQEFVKQTLQKAVANNKTVWAYLFCWPRWTWKTSSARIMAKAVNCLKSKDWNPCNDCDICKSINTESLVDVIEIDAASHTWVDNIREIIEKARFSPTHANFKVYIIDEVHMLSKWAFNALLKILEEPPAHVKFILATTETHKVPETIISRCQRYDFKRINENDIKNRLIYVAKQENINIDEKSLDYIAKTSAWGLRNALSLFEQLISDNEINYENIINTLWIVSDKKLEKFLNKLLESDNSIINDYEEIISEGKNIKLFFKELIFFTKDITTKKLITWEDINSYLKILSSLDDTYSKTKNSLDENTTFLIGLLKIVSNYKEEVLEIKETIKKDIAKPIKKIVEQEIKVEDTPFTDEITTVEEKDLSQNDLTDIFWEEINTNTSHSELVPQGYNNSEELKKLNSNQKIDPEINSGWQKLFNKDNFIEELKKLWAKWGLTMSIRWADTFLNWDILTIKFKTSFALKSVNTTDNLSLLNWALEAMWINASISFK